MRRPTAILVARSSRPVGSFATKTIMTLESPLNYDVADLKDFSPVLSDVSVTWHDDYDELNCLRPRVHHVLCIASTTQLVFFHL